MSKGNNQPSLLVRVQQGTATSSQDLLLGATFASLDRSLLLPFVVVDNDRSIVAYFRARAR